MSTFVSLLSKEQMDRLPERIPALPVMGNGERPQVVSGITFAAVLTAVGCSRLFVRHTLKQKNLECLIEQTELVVSELVTNAVRTTGVMEREPSWAELSELALIHVRLLIVNRSLIVEVWDCDSNPPVLQDQNLESEGGRGLFLVQQISKNWNFYYLQSGGKVVWAELAIPPLAWVANAEV